MPISAKRVIRNADILLYLLDWKLNYGIGFNLFKQFDHQATLHFISFARQFLPVKLTAVAKSQKDTKRIRREIFHIMLAWLSIPESSKTMQQHKTAQQFISFITYFTDLFGTLTSTWCGVNQQMRCSTDARSWKNVRTEKYDDIFSGVSENLSEQYPYCWRSVLIHTHDKAQSSFLYLYHING